MAVAGVSASTRGTIHYSGPRGQALGARHPVASAPAATEFGRSASLTVIDMKTFAVSCILLVAALVGAACWALWPRPNRLVVTNESGQAIAFLAITVGGDTIRFENVPPGAQVSAPFRIVGDDHYAVRGQMADGQTIADDCGYVSNGMEGVLATFVIRPGGKVEFKDKWGGA